MRLLILWDFSLGERWANLKARQLAGTALIRSVGGPPSCRITPILNQTDQLSHRVTLAHRVLTTNRHTLLFLRSRISPDPMAVKTESQASSVRHDSLSVRVVFSGRDPAVRICHARSARGRRCIGPSFAGRAGGCLRGPRGRRTAGRAARHVSGVRVLDRGDPLESDPRRYREPRGPRPSPAAAPRSAPRAQAARRRAPTAVAVRGSAGQPRRAGGVDLGPRRTWPVTVSTSA